MKVESVVALVMGCLKSVSSLVTRWRLTARKRRLVLMRPYGKLVKIGSNALGVARELESRVAIHDPSGDPDEVVRLESRRHALRADLARLGLHIAMLEPDQALREKVREFVASQPFLAWPWPPQFGVGNYSHRFQRFQEEVSRFEGLLRTLVDLLNSRMS